MTPAVFEQHQARKVFDTSPHLQPGQVTAAHSLEHSPDQKPTGLPPVSGEVPEHCPRQTFLLPTAREDSPISAEVTLLQLQSRQGVPWHVTQSLQQAVVQPTQAVRGVAVLHLFHWEHSAIPSRCGSSLHPSNRWPYLAENDQQYNDEITQPLQRVQSL